MDQTVFAAILFGFAFHLKFLNSIVDVLFELGNAVSKANICLDLSASQMYPTM